VCGVRFAAAAKERVKKGKKRAKEWKKDKRKEKTRRGGKTKRAFPCMLGLS